MEIFISPRRTRAAPQLPMPPCQVEVWVLCADHSLFYRAHALTPEDILGLVFALLSCVSVLAWNSQMPVSLSHSEIRVGHQDISRGHPPTKDLAVMLLPPLTLEPLPVHRQLHLLRPQELPLFPFLPNRVCKRSTFKSFTGL